MALPKTQQPPATDGSDARTWLKDKLLKLSSCLWGLQGSPEVSWLSHSSAFPTSLAAGGGITLQRGFAQRCLLWEQPPVQPPLLIS